MPQKIKSYFSSLAQNVVYRIPLLPNIVTESKIVSCYDNNTVQKFFSFQHLGTSSEKILSTLKGLIPSKVAGIDNLSDKF